MILGTVSQRRNAEFSGKAILSWANKNGVNSHHIDPAQSSVKQSAGPFSYLPRAQQNGDINASNGSLRDACLNEEIFDSLADARHKPTPWRHDDVRLHFPWATRLGRSIRGA